VITPHVVMWAAEECRLQGSGELSVAWLVEGWRWAHRRRNRPITLGMVLALGEIVEPRWNKRGLRQCNVQVGGSVKMDWSMVPDHLDRLIEAQGRLSPGLWFREYEEVHPFRDGNGRTGSILYNVLNGTMGQPVAPPNYWDDPRRPDLKPKDLAAWASAPAHLIGWGP
jgi:hypothetical protein